MELSEFQVNVGQACVEQVAYVIAGSLAVVADVEDLPDLGEGESGGLAAVDEVDPGEALGRVVAVAAGRALGRGQEPLVFIEPQSLRGRAGRFSELPDPHPHPSCVTGLTLDLPLYWKL